MKMSSTKAPTKNEKRTAVKTAGENTQAE